MFVEQSKINFKFLFNPYYKYQNIWFKNQKSDPLAKPEYQISTWAPLFQSSTNKIVKNIIFEYQKVAKNH